MTSMSNFEKIRQIYNFPEVRVATWRDPKGSILPARGGPKGPTISADNAAEPFTPSPYRVKYKPRPLPQPTDDEDSEDEKLPEQKPKAEGMQSYDICDTPS